MDYNIALSVENLSYKYPDNNDALNDVSFKIEKNNIVFFHGENGAGKTTLFQCITGLLKVTNGIIKINGVVTKKEKQRMRRVSIVFQNANDQLIAGSVFDEVAYGAINLGLSEQEVIKRTEQALKTMNIEHLRDKPPHFLSYGQKKRVTIASILTMDSDIIILDEPTAGLDTKQTEELINILTGLAANEKTLLISTHDADFSFRCADKIIVLDGGRLICEGRPAYVFSQDSVLLKTGLLKPFIMEVYETITGQSAVNASSLPKDRYELFEILKRSDIN